jgi:sirohydrochlorin ferrochelatase
MVEHILIVSHGQPSDPAPAASALRALAGRVAALLPGWQVGSATLAEPGAIAEGVAGQRVGLVYPLFMAGGWFTRVQIPSRLAEAGAADWTVLEPFGCDPALHDLCVDLIRKTGAGEVILAAHGSFKSAVPADIAAHVAGRIGREVPARVMAGFIDQEPKLSGLGGFGPGSVCLPFFAAEGGHVSEDIPAALAQAGFRGRILPPVGADDRVPGIIAAAIRRGDPVCSATCRWAR